MAAIHSRKYDAPLYCAAWATAEADAAVKETPSGSRIGYVICGGGGGDGATGVRNLLVVAQYDAELRELSEPLHTLLTDDDAACAMAVHPNGHELICSFPVNNRHNGKLRLLRLTGGEKLRVEFVDRELVPLENIGEQRSLAFNTDGKLFATGGRDGHLRVFKWPSLELILDRHDAHRSIKDLDFSLDGAFLAATDDVGPSRIWDLKDSSPAAVLPLNKAGFCRFSRDGARPYLYVTSAEGDIPMHPFKRSLHGRGVDKAQVYLFRADFKGYITIWNTKWKKIGSKKLQDQPISAFSISSDGKLLAIGSPEGHVSIVNASKLSVLKRIKDAHMVFVTAADFSPDNRSLLSVSGDSSARVTACHDHRGWRLLWILLIALILLSLALSSGLGRGMLESFQNASPPDTSHDMI